MTFDTNIMADLIDQAKNGSSQAFSALTEPYRRPLLMHCYHMLGSFQDAEDILQESLFAAWQGLKGFEARASLKTWLFKIATNRCLNGLRTMKRRPAKAWDIPGVEPLEPSRVNEIVWLDPFPDEPRDASLVSPAPDTLLERSQAISLAFVTALQSLPPRQTAALLLRDVIGFDAEETAAILESSVDAANSALKRARSTMEARRSGHETPPPPGTPAEAAVVSQFVAAWEAADVNALVTLLTDDAFLSMPPLPLEYIGRDISIRFLGNLLAAGRRYCLVPTRANGQPALGVYLDTATGRRHGVGLYVLTLAGDKIRGLTRFEGHVLTWFGLPGTLT